MSDIGLRMEQKLDRILEQHTLLRDANAKLTTENHTLKQSLRSLRMKFRGTKMGRPPKPKPGGTQ